MSIENDVNVWKELLLTLKKLQIKVNRCFLFTPACIKLDNHSDVAVIHQVLQPVTTMPKKFSSFLNNQSTCILPCTCELLFFLFGYQLEVRY